MFSVLQMQSRTKALFTSYCKDWILVVVVLVAFSIVDQLEPFHRQFSVRDVTIQHPFAKQETVPVWLLLTLSFLLPMATMGAIAVFQRRSYTDLHNALLGLFLAQSLVLIVTDSIKIAVGRPRPDFLDRCLSLYDNANAGIPLDQLNNPVNLLSNSTICTRTDLLRDGFKSFPSGHSSFSFGGLGFLSMYLAGKLHLFDERGHIYKSLVVLAPMILAALIATSRVADYRHHWQDVTVGSFIGFFFAVFAYRQYYPSLASNKSDRPFSPRIREDFLPGGSFLGIGSGSNDNNGQRYRDDAGDDDDTRVALDGPSHHSAENESGIGFGQFFRRDRTDESLTGNGHGGPNKNVVGTESRLLPV
ncbi:hypothetical protein KI688_003169 [Linnemannia hyalina]|uniref:Phosphatidic acid phosphatase type 2/haloperoxidase domain-containing protein n=1 Tax=Linnemannia hyalina TaxID=64524 RepID=A0A9P7XPW4_9FUNG|nr:hypothetical protein KI688_003169 [Linnemannia hyalina]